MALFIKKFSSKILIINDLRFDPLAQLVEQFPFKEWAVGSNPTRVTIFSLISFVLYVFVIWPLHLAVRIPPFHGGYRGSSPLGVTTPMFKKYRDKGLILYCGRLAQLVERYPYKVDVTSSSLVATTTFVKMLMER